MIDASVFFKKIKLIKTQKVWLITKAKVKCNLEWWYSIKILHHDVAHRITKRIYRSVTKEIVIRRKIR